MTRVKLILCIACANVVRDRGKSVLVCPECHFRIGRARYERIRSYAETATRFGYAYRRHFESRPPKNVHPSISVDDALLFAGLAAVGGIIGNASYDVVKAFARRVFLNVAAKIKGDQRDYEVEEVVEYVQEYHTHGVSNLSLRVRTGIREEFLTEYEAQFYLRIKRRGARFTGATLRRGREEAQRAWIERPPPPPADFAGFASAVRRRRRARNARK